MKNNENLYSNLLAQSFELFEEARQKSIELMEQDRFSEIRDCWGKVIDITRTATVVQSYKDFHLESAEKTAVIITGLSCTGKSTVSRLLSNEYPDFDVIRFDEVGMRLIESNKIMYMLNMELLDTHMIIAMGELMQKAADNNLNLIIEGEYCTLNARGALINTLRKLGYENICIVSTLNVPNEIQKICAEKRSVIYVFADQLKPTEKGNFMLRTFYADVFSEIEKATDVKKIRRKPEYKKHIDDIEKQRENEFLTDMIPIQANYRYTFRCK